MPMSAQQSAENLLHHVKKKLRSAHSYSVDLQLAVDIPFIDAPPSKAKLYYKAPNLIHLEAEGFAMLPKQGADLNVLRILLQPHATVDAGQEQFRGVTTRKVKILPTDDDSRIALATFFIDTVRLLPLKASIVTRNGGTIVIELDYANTHAAAFALPSYAKLIFDVPAMDLPKTMTGDFDKQPTNSNGKPVKAIVEIRYSNYKININIPNTVFNSNSN